MRTTVASKWAVLKEAEVISGKIPNSLSAKTISTREELERESKWSQTKVADLKNQGIV